MIGCGFVSSTHIIWSMMMKDPDGFAPLAKVSGDKKVDFGLITTKRPELEEKAISYR